MKTPDTIRNPRKFAQSPSAGFDGIFDWSWTQGCFGEGKITPMDFDGVVERRGQFIVFETKESGTPVPLGQLYTLQALHRLGCFTVVIIWGKLEPEAAEVWYPGTPTKERLLGREAIRGVVQRWYAWADKKQKG